MLPLRTQSYIHGRPSNIFYTALKYEPTNMLHIEGLDFNSHTVSVNLELILLTYHVHSKYIQIKVDELHR